MTPKDRAKLLAAVEAEAGLIHLMVPSHHPLPLFTPNLEHNKPGRIPVAPPVEK